MKKTISLILILLLFTSVSTSSESELRRIYQEGIIEGYFLEHEDGKVVIEEYGGKKYRIPMDRNIWLEIDTRGGIGIEEFKPGMEVYAELKGRSINYMDAFSTNLPGYIQPGGKLRIGRVNKIDKDQIGISLGTGKEETYFLSPSTIVLKNKINSNPKELYVGDRVKLYFDQDDTSYISRLHIEGSSIEIQELYRGEIELVDGLEDVLSLGKINKFTNGSWKALEKNLKLPYNSDLPIYIGGEKIRPGDLKYYKGKTVYMAIKDDFGKEKIERMVVKAQNEQSFSDKINEVNWFSSQIKLDNTKNININEGTMLIKNGRLVDVESLNPKSDGLIIADGIGNDLNANLIYVYNEDINNSNIGQDRIYSGRLNTILPDKLYLKDFFLLDQNKWIGFQDEKELYYDEDTYIYNVEDGKEVSQKEFFSSNFSQDENNNENTNSRDWYGYLYTEGDRIASVFVKKSIDSISQERTTIGKIEAGPVENPHMGWTIKVRDGKTWSSANEEWMAQNASIDIYLKDAMIIKNGKRIGIEELKTGDSLYFIRNDNMAKVVVVK